MRGFDEARGPRPLSGGACGRERCKVQAGGAPGACRVWGCDRQAGHLQVANPAAEWPGRADPSLRSG